MYLLTRVQNKVVAALLVLLLLFYPVYVSAMVVSDFSRAPIPDTDKGQFLTGWPSGVGVEKSISYFNEVSKDGKIFIATGGQFGLLPYALEVYLHDNPNIEIKGYWPITNTIPDDIVEKSGEMPAYVIFYQPCPDCKEIGLAPETWPLEQVFQIEKKEENVYYTVYRVVQQ